MQHWAGQLVMAPVFLKYKNKSKEVVSSRRKSLKKVGRFAIIIIFDENDNYGFHVLSYYVAPQANFLNKFRVFIPTFGRFSFRTTMENRVM